MTEECTSCGTDVERPVIADEGGAYCFDCVCDMPACDDCDVPLETGGHLCSPCHARRSVQARN